MNDLCFPYARIEHEMVYEIVNYCYDQIIKSNKNTITQKMRAIHTRTKAYRKQLIFSVTNNNKDSRSRQQRQRTVNL